MTNSILGAKIHLAEIELSRKIGGRSRSFLGLRVFRNDPLNLEEKFSNAKRAEMEVRGEQGGCSWFECSWCSFRLLKGRYVSFILQESLETPER